MADKHFGKCLIRSQSKTTLSDRIENGNAFNRKSKNIMISDLDPSAVDDFISIVEMDADGVEVLRVNQNDAILIEPTVRKALQTMNINQFDYEHCPIPRKPAWTTKMTKEEVDRNEKNAFLKWRREIALMESGNQNIKVTPFEKNLEVWRQLWRVVEKSDIAIQIVDARNPLLYYTSDLMTYASEQSPPKTVMLIVNKADFLTEYQRKCWAKTFENMGLKFVFYSAYYAQEKIEADAAVMHETGSPLPEEFVDVDEIEALIDDMISSSRALNKTVNASSGGLGLAPAAGGHFDTSGGGTATASSEHNGEEEEKGEVDIEKKSDSNNGDVCYSNRDSERDSDNDSKEDKLRVSVVHSPSTQQSIPIAAPLEASSRSGSRAPVTVVRLEAHERQKLMTKVLTRAELVFLMEMLPEKLQVLYSFEFHVCMYVRTYKSIRLRIYFCMHIRPYTQFCKLFYFTGRPLLFRFSFTLFALDVDTVTQFVAFLSLPLSLPLALPTPTNILPCVYS